MQYGTEVIRLYTNTLQEVSRGGRSLTENSKRKDPKSSEYENLTGLVSTTQIRVLYLCTILCQDTIDFLTFADPFGDYVTCKDEDGWVNGWVKLTGHQ